MTAAVRKRKAQAIPIQEPRDAQTANMRAKYAAYSRPHAPQDVHRAHSTWRSSHGMDGDGARLGIKIGFMMCMVRTSILMQALFSGARSRSRCLVCSSAAFVAQLLSRLLPLQLLLQLQLPLQLQLLREQAAPCTGVSAAAPRPEPMQQESWSALPAPPLSPRRRVVACFSRRMGAWSRGWSPPFA